MFGLALKVWVVMVREKVLEQVLLPLRGGEPVWTGCFPVGTGLVDYAVFGHEWVEAARKVSVATSMGNRPEHCR